MSNHSNDTFCLNVLDYMLPFDSGVYFSNNWLKGNIEISIKKKTRTIELEFLPVEELINLLGWLEKIREEGKKEQTIFDFIDPCMRFRIWKKGHGELLKFIYHSEDKSIYTWDMALTEENVQEFKNQIQELLIKFPIR